jgi:glycosyltransferase 2 family protein
VTRGRLVRAALSLALLALVWQAVDGAAVLERLAALDLVWILAAIALLQGQTLLSALRWRLTAARLGQPMLLGHAVREYFLSQTVNLTLPGGVVGDAARAVRGRGMAGLERASQAVLFERLSGQAALVVVTLGAGGLSLVVPGGVSPPAALIGGFVLLGGAVFVAVLGLLLAARRRPRLAAWWQALRWSVLHRDVRLHQSILSLGTVATNVLSFAAAAAAVGVLLPPAAIFSVVPLVLFAMLLPFTIGGWGLREGAAVALLPLVGATPEAAFTASAAFGIAFLLASLLGLAVSWALPQRQPLA